MPRYKLGEAAASQGLSETRTQALIPAPALPLRLPQELAVARPCIMHGRCINQIHVGTDVMVLQHHAGSSAAQ